MFPPQAPPQQQSGGPGMPGPGMASPTGGQPGSPNSSRPTQGGVPNAQIEQLAQFAAQQQINQAMQQFQQAAGVVADLGSAFPDIQDQTNQLAAAVMQLGTKAIAALQATPISPPM